MTEANSRKLFLMRHGERVDFTFGDWISSCFDSNGNYSRTDLNMPETLPKRTDGHLAFCNDTPLTRVGVFQAESTGEAFKKAQLDVTHVYCSPALRCVQTCDAFLRGCQKRDQIKMKIEPGLFEWLEWYADGLPKFMTPEELAGAGYNVDLEYKPYIPVKELAVLEETFQQYYTRKFSIAKCVVKAHENCNILFVGHSSTLEMCSRELVGREQRSFLETVNVIRKIPYCSLMQVTQIEEKWEIDGKPLLGFEQSQNNHFNEKMLME